ncbi:MAG TPA: TetR/AcrR family transcriptional regulator [Acidimicrobiaceae bacterium]|nr:TetR/AcrR family transcriptional regulator [Acidimicrobiaceae bacterium]
MAGTEVSAEVGLSEGELEDCASEAPCRPMRADAQRNRQRILEAAEAVFAKDGLAVPVDVVAERAGLGVGTLYRHFPTKEALFEAIVVTKLDQLVEAANAEQGGDAAESFFAFIARMADEATLKHDLFDALAAAGVDFKSRCGDRVEELRGSLDRLRQRAVDSGQLRADVTIDEIMTLVMGACRQVERPGATPQDPHKMIAIVCDGLRTGH